MLHSTVFAVVVIPVSVLTLYVVPGIPVVTALVTKSHAPGWLKVAMTALLAAIAAAVTTAVNGGTDFVVTWRFVGTVGLALGEAMVSYLVLRKPVIERIEKRTGNVGISA